MNAASPSSFAADQLRAIERERLRALVRLDMAASMDRHADDFHLINPAGVALTRAEYLGALAAGTLVYHVFEVEPGTEIMVRLHGDAAVLRYRSRIKVEVNGQRSPRLSCWHTDLYEHRDGQWVVVWSQATVIAA